MNSAWNKYLNMIPLGLLFAIFILQSIPFQIHDFANYYFSGKLLGDGLFKESVYFPYEFNSAIERYGYSGIFASFAPNTPFLALFFCPFSLLPIALAKGVFNIITTGLFLFSLFRLLSYYNIRLGYLLMVPFFFYLPIRNELLFGQVYFLLFFLITESWLAYEKKEFTATGLFLAIAILLKVFPAILLLIFVFQRSYKPLFFTTLFISTGVCLSAIFVGFDVWLFWLTDVFQKASAGEIATEYVANYQSAHMFLKELFVFHSTENPQPFFNYPQFFSVGILVFKLLIVSIGWFVTKLKKATLDTLAYWMLAIILLSPYGSTYTFIMLLIPFLAIAKAQLSMVQKTVVLILLFLINNVPLSLFLSYSFPFNYWRFLGLIAFFVIFVLLLYRNINWKIIGSICVVGLLVMLIFTQKKASSASYVLPSNTPILIYDYHIENNKLTYFYWNEKGENADTITFEGVNAIPLEIRNNQIYHHNKPLTFDNSNKKKPMLIDGKTLLFLSDKERGIGFYTLQKIEFP
jgi:hypothetical protein